MSAGHSEAPTVMSAGHTVYLAEYARRIFSFTISAPSITITVIPLKGSYPVKKYNFPTEQQNLKYKG